MSVGAVQKRISKQKEGDLPWASTGAQTRSAADLFGAKAKICRANITYLRSPMNAHDLPYHLLRPFADRVCVCGTVRAFS